MRILFFALLFLFCLTSTTLAVDPILIITTDKATTDKWFQVPIDAGPRLVTTSKVYPGQDLYFYVAAGGYLRDEAGNLKLQYDVTVSGPDGKKIFERTNLLLHEGKSTNPQIIYMSMEGVAIRFDRSDKLGQYFVSVSVRDLVANTTKSTQGTFALIDYQEQKYFTEDAELNLWINTYYQKPTPEKAIDGYIYYVNSPLLEKHPANFLGLTAFYIKIFNDNKYLVPHFLSRYAEQSNNTKIAMLHIIRFIDVDKTAFLKGLSSTEQAYYEKVGELPKSYDEIKIPAQLDMLWSTFFASGEIEPIRRLVSVLDYATFKGALEAFKNSAQTEDDKARARKDLLYRAAQWSLGSNIKQHPLVRDYCITIYNRGELSDTAKEELGKLLGY